MTQDEKDRILREPPLPEGAPRPPIPTATRKEQEAFRREVAARGMTIEKMLEWKWLFDDEEYWQAISESRGGVGICTKRIP